MDWGGTNSLIACINKLKPRPGLMHSIPRKQNLRTNSQVDFPQKGNCSGYSQWNHCFISASSYKSLSPIPVGSVLLTALGFVVVAVYFFSRVQLFATPWTVAHQSMGLSRQEYWSGLPFPSPGDLPDPGIEKVQACVPSFAVQLISFHLLGERRSNVLHWQALFKVIWSSIVTWFSAWTTLKVLF